MKVIQWNILADGLAIRNQSTGATSFIHVPIEYLSWNYRRAMIYDQLKMTEGDLVCLQGVDHYEDIMENVGSDYKGVFMAHPHSRCLRSIPNNGPDGIAILYKSSVLHLIKRKELTLPTSGGALPNDISLLGLFMYKSTKKFCLCVTALRTGILYSQTRLLQGDYLLDQINEFTQNRRLCPVICCGDFNASPIEPVYGHFASSKPPLVSAYSTANGREPDYTVWKHSALKVQKHAADYIWYSPDAFNLVGVLELPLEAHEKEVVGGLPSKYYPSHHLAIGAEFTFKL
jgi:nocturnin